MYEQLKPKKQKRSIIGLQATFLMIGRIIEGVKAPLKEMPSMSTITGLAYAVAMLYLLILCLP